MIRRDVHHLAHDRLSWESRPEGAYVRGVLLAKDMARSAHNLLHAETGAVPVPLYHSLQFVANRLLPTSNIYTDVDEYCRLLEQANKRAKCGSIEVGVNQLSIEALRTQIPYLLDGLPSSRRSI